MKTLINEKDIIERIIETESIITLFQPIITVKSNRISILEALSRGVNPDNGEIISPFVLFDQANKSGLIRELDRICIIKSLDEFKKISNDVNNVLLSININMRSIVEAEDYSWFNNLVESAGINPKRIIIEILEEETIDNKILESFVKYNREKGYLIAIDDIGSGYSGLIRINELKPDIIKIDKSLIFKISNKKSNQMIVTSLTELGHRLGILVTSEGIETVEDAMKLMEIGVDLQQGYYYSRPDNNIESIKTNSNEGIKSVSTSYKKYISKRNKETKQIKRFRKNKLNEILKELTSVSKSELENKLKEIINSNVHVEFMYVLDNSGIMITDTISKQNMELDYAHYIFKPANKGEDFSLKNYFIHLDTKKEIYITSPYISTATGIECVTASKRFITNDNEECVLCIDLMSSHKMCNLE